MNENDELRSRLLHELRAKQRPNPFWWVPWAAPVVAFWCWRYGPITLWAFLGLIILSCWLDIVRNAR